MTRRGLCRASIAAAVALAACAAVPNHAPGLWRFEPAPSEGGAKLFHFITRADRVYPLDTADGEAARRRWLEDYMLEKTYCRDDFTLVRRDVKPAPAGTPDAWVVTYVGRCKP